MKKIKLLLLLISISIFSLNAQTQFTKGLTVIVEFADAPFNNSIDSISMMMNQVGFKGYGNNGSVRDYYLVQSVGKIDLTSEVIKVALPGNVSDYYGNSSFRHDMTDVVAQINLKYPNGFQGLSTYPDGSLVYFSCLAKSAKGGWAFGDQNVAPIKNNGINAKIINGNFSTYGNNNNIDINVICHEIGHAIFGWADHYGMNSLYKNIGQYCLMGSGGSSVSPMPISPPLRNTKGWILNVNDITNSATTTYTIKTNDYTQVYKYSNIKNPQEYLLISAVRHDGYYLQETGEYPTDEGLAVWYVKEGIEPGAVSPRMFLIQADGLNEMHDSQTSHNDQRGDLSDLFNDEFPILNDISHPFLRWEDGSLTGLNISNISSVGAEMTFKFNSSVCNNVPTYSVYPSVYKEGDFVQHNGTKYQSLVNDLFNVTPGTAEHWWKTIGACATNIAPLVTFTAPAKNAVFTLGNNVKLVADAIDADGSIAKVEFLNSSNVVVGTDLTAPYELILTNLLEGSYVYQVRAFDNNGAISNIASNNFSINASNICSASQYSAVIAYNANAVVQLNGIKYRANWWTLGEQPDLNSGEAGSGKPWKSLGQCNSRIGNSENTSSLIYPNPTKGVFTIVSATETSTVISNIFGVEVAHLSLVEGANEINISIPSGIYYISLNNVVTKLIVE